MAGRSGGEKLEIKGGRELSTVLEPALAFEAAQ